MPFPMIVNITLIIGIGNVIIIIVVRLYIGSYTLKSTAAVLDSLCSLLKLLSLALLESLKTPSPPASSSASAVFDSLFSLNEESLALFSMEVFEEVLSDSEVLSFALNSSGVEAVIITSFSVNKPSSGSKTSVIELFCNFAKSSYVKLALSTEDISFGTSPSACGVCSVEVDEECTAQHGISVLVPISCLSALCAALNEDYGVTKIVQDMARYNPFKAIFLNRKESKIINQGVKNNAKIL
ncbi:hypothetical protein FF38_07914 [Lucilia cuprina]|uniref:Uncharacterized protein n=1 Tax=Lucilia cuprina TaxID=7375 RepID=A0A0L0BN80_LUCCU|nr:hypothetical protein FF38_07914 [Lucilia cuprina]